MIDRVKVADINETELPDCEFCQAHFREAKSRGEEFIYQNTDGHVARDLNTLEDRQVTNAKYGL